MTDKEYIIVSALTRLRAANTLVRDAAPHLAVLGTTAEVEIERVWKKSLVGIGRLTEWLERKLTQVMERE